MPVQRQAQLAQWLAATLNIPVPELNPISGDASFRRYFRFNHQNQSLIAVDAPPAHENNQAFVAVSTILESNGLHVPHVHHVDFNNGFLLISDLGDGLYLSKLNLKTADHLYHQAFDAIISMLSIDPAQLRRLPHYDSAALNDEMALFDQWFIVRHLKLKLSETEQTTITQTFKLLTDSALAQPQHFVHRDFHSRNLMICKMANKTENATQPGLIDFQDAVVGPISYDLVSLLKDCYICWPDEQVKAWCQQFYDQIQAKELISYDFEAFFQQFQLMGMQRHIKVLGIFCRLYYRDHKANYLKDLQLTFDYLITAVAKYPQFSAFHQLLLDKIQPSLTQRYSELYPLN